MKIDDLHVFARQGVRIVSTGSVDLDSRAAPDKGLGRLVPSQLLKAQVLEITNDGKAVLEIQGQKLLAETENLLLKPGDFLWLEVKETKPVPVLMPAVQKGTISDLVRLLLINNPLIGKALEEVIGLTAQKNGDSPLSGPWAEIVTFLNETAIKDDAVLIKLLKTITIGLRPGNEIQTPSQGVLEQPKAGTLPFNAQTGVSIRSGVLRFVELLQTMSSLNTHNASDPSSSFYIFPCWFGNGAGWGEWLFSMDEGEKDESSQKGKGYNLTFYLNMSRIGPMNLMVKVAGTALTGSFSSADREVLGYVEQNVAELREAMKKLGFASIHFSCRLDQDPLLPQLVEELKEQGKVDNLRFLDVTA